MLYCGQIRAPTDMVGVPTVRACPEDHAGAIKNPEFRIRTLLPWMVDNLGCFSWWWFLCKVKLCYVFQSFGCNSQASWAEWIFIFTSQPARHLACKDHPKKLRKTHQNLSLHKNHHPGKRPKLWTNLSSGLWRFNILRMAFFCCWPTNLKVSTKSCPYPFHELSSDTLPFVTFDPFFQP